MKDFINELFIRYHNWRMAHAAERSIKTLHMNLMLSRIYNRSKRQVARMERAKGLI